MSKLLPALQKFYNALKHLEQFSLESSFFDNIGCLDVFLSEFRSTTLVLQVSLGNDKDPIYIKNRDAFLLKDEKVASWLNDQRVTVIHKHPFKLKKFLRVVIYDSGNALEFKKFEQTVEDERPLGDYEQMIRNSFLSIAAPEICFSAQYVFVNDADTQEVNVFDIVESGVISMWKFLHAMKADLSENEHIVNQLMGSIDEIILKNPQRWMIDALDYCYYRSSDSFERGQSMTMMLPDVRVPIAGFLSYAESLKAPISDFYDAFIWVHSWIYIQQGKNLMSTFFIEYEDGTYHTIPFISTLRTTMYRYINRVANLVSENSITNVYLVTEMVGYTPLDIDAILPFLQLNYKEREKYRTKTFLTFYRINALGDVSPIMIDSDDLIDRLSISAVLGGMKTQTQTVGPVVMLTPIVRSFKNKLN